jgi:multicomponent Na+:H+ antiporter subunit E
VLYANSITLTPGTVSIKMEDDEITVHALTREAAEGVETGVMDAKVTRLEGLS